LIALVNLILVPYQRFQNM